MADSAEYGWLRSQAIAHEQAAQNSASGIDWVVKEYAAHNMSMPALTTDPVVAAQYYLKSADLLTAAAMLPGQNPVESLTAAASALAKATKLAPELVKNSVNTGGIGSTASAATASSIFSTPVLIGIGAIVLIGGALIYKKYAKKSVTKSIALSGMRRRRHK
jgi:hypothetical protein